MKTAERIFWGLVLIGAAVFLILNQMGLITATISIGMVVMGVICAAIFVSGVVNRSFGGVFFSLGLAWLVFDKVLGLPEVSWQIVLLIVALLTVGFHFIFPNKTRKHRNHVLHKAHDDKWSAYEKEDEVGEHQKVTDETSNGYVVSTNSFGATAKYINEQDFKGAELKNSFGEMKVYFDSAVIVTSPITVKVQNSFGELQLFMPKGWNVQSNITVFAGDFKENNKPASGDGPTVYVEGNVSFGEIDVTYI